MPRASNRQSKVNWDGNTYGLKTLGRGVSGVVLGLDKRLVVKISDGSPESIRDLSVERDAYRRFSKGNKNITKCYDYNDSRGLILERLDETVRHRLRREGPQPLQTVLNWSLGAANALDFIHSRNVIQSDVGCHNMLLDHNGMLKLCDFSGSSIERMNATVSYETRSQAPLCYGQPDEDSDIFALGSSIYEMYMGFAPYHDQPEHEVERLYEAQMFPPHPEHMDQDLWIIIQKCWTYGFKGQASKVANEVDKVMKKLERINSPKNDTTRLANSTITESSAHENRQSKTRIPPRTHSDKQHKKSDNNDKVDQNQTSNFVAQIWSAVKGLWWNENNRRSS